MHDSSPSVNEQVEPASRARIASRTTVWALAVNFVLSIGKLIAALMAGSAALLADALHSLSDIVTDVVVLVGVGMARKPADEGHRWGHGKIETLASVIVGVLLMGAAIQIFGAGLGAVREVLAGEVLPAPQRLALAVAVASIVAKEVLFRYTRRVARRIHSQVLLANAWHQRSDALSSAAVALGIGAATLGGESWRVLDPVAAMVVAVIIAKVAVSILKVGLSELIEGSAGPDVLGRITQTALTVEGVRRPHAVRARKLGAAIAADLHVVVPGDLDLAAAHDRGLAVEERVAAALGPGSFVTVHLDPGV